MAPICNGRILFMEPADEAQGYPVPGKTTKYDASETIDLDTAPLDGGVLIKTLELSIDPSLRVSMRSAYSGYTFTVGQPITTFGVGAIIRSENPAFQVGDHVYGYYQAKEYNIMKKTPVLRILKNEEKLPWSLYVGIAGMPGQTAVYGWKEYAKPSKGDVVFVTTGAGSVGSLVIQLAKRDGLKVIASAGSDEKVKFMKEIGADIAFNYKTTDTKKVLEKEGPINIFWDHVGGEILEVALDYAARHARFIECGMMSGFNEAYKPIPNMYQVVMKELQMFGLMVLSLHDKYKEEFYNTIPALVARRELKYMEDVRNGLESVSEAILAVQKGTNMGKCVIHVTDG